MLAYTLDFHVVAHHDPPETPAGNCLVQQPTTVEAKRSKEQADNRRRLHMLSSKTTACACAGACAVHEESVLL